MSVKLLLVDDHEVVRHGLRSLIEAKVQVIEFMEASNGHEALMLMKDFSPDVVIMDYEMPKFNGIYATREILKIKPNTRILLLTMHQGQDIIFEGIEAGVSGFLPKSARLDELAEAIQALANGQTWFKGNVAELIANKLLDPAKPGKLKVKRELSGREKEILTLFALGETSAGIAKKLSISKHTVDNHKSNIFKKLNLKNNSCLTRYAIRKQLIRL